MKKKVFILLVLGLLTATLPGCLAYVPPPPLDAVYAPGPPPEPVVEVAPFIPFPGAVWIGGYWGRPPHPGGVWRPGRWHHHPRGYYYNPGRWR